jgi:hypothetical protein
VSAAKCSNSSKKMIQTLWCQELHSNFSVYIAHGHQMVQVHVRSSRSICLTLTPRLQPSTEKKPVSRACSQGMTSCFSSASVAYRLPAMYFLQCSKIWKSLNPLQPTGSVTSYGAYGWHVADHPSYSRDLAIPNDFHLFGPLNKHMAGKIFARGADMKQTVLLPPSG